MKLRMYRISAIALSAALFLVITTANVGHAEEGMFMMDKLGRLPLAKAGLKIKPRDIYNADGTGLSLAVPRLSIGCSSSFVSPDGLILTNHHCAFDALVSASTTDENLADTGFRAASRAEELPAQGYAVDLTIKQEDVTSGVLAGIDAADEEAVAKRIAELEAQEKAKLGPDVRVQIQALTEGLYYYLFAYQRINDIRVVYAPPANIGYYGGDPDNFEWTRHAGDFAFLRAYVAPDGAAAAYSKQNVPYKPKKYLSVSAAGIKDGDYTMIIGYPGRTNRYRESFSVNYNQNHRLPLSIEALVTRVKALEMVSKTDPKKAVELQSDIFSLNNVIKAYEGAVLAMRRANLIRQRQESEAKLTAWINGD
ncbi:MAG: S46 family peptidase, partial [Acidobacteriota bacterium]|nr:S46 family peptidase [Acidobacteriota bacterium]